MKKYIVNDLPNQTIAGSLRIDGDLKVTDGTYSFATYRALLTQTGTYSGPNIAAFNGALVIGETYTITNYLGTDDFSNVAQLVSGTMNSTGCEFIATGEIPLRWDSGSTIESVGDLIVRVLENNLGYDINWTQWMGPGIYIGTRSYDGYYNSGLFNDWPRSTTSVAVSNPVIFAPPAGPFTQFAGPSTLSAKDDCLAVFVYDYGTMGSIGDWLYNTPIEVKVRQELDTTPITIGAAVVPSFPFGSVAFDFVEDDNIYIDSIYTGNPAIVNDMGELVDLLNSNENTSYFGTFAENGGILTLTMPMNLKRQFSPNGTLSFAVFAD